MDLSLADSWRGVVVLGTHRSGTSAVTGVIDALGLPVCRAEDRFELRPWNARGNFESLSISVFDESLLNRLGGAWWAPPLPPVGWGRESELHDLGIEAAFLFAAAHPTARWVWKDPRACVLMPFWDEILGTDVPRIVVLRNPLESAASLRQRNRIATELALAMSERNLRTSLRDSAGRTVWVTTYDDLLDDPRAWCLALADFVRASGLRLDDPLPIETATSFVDDSLRHHRDEPSASDGPGISVGFRRLWDWAMGRRGVHRAFSIKGLPDESELTGPILRAAATSFIPLEDGRGNLKQGPLGAGSDPETVPPKKD